MTRQKKRGTFEGRVFALNGNSHGNKDSFKGYLRAVPPSRRAQFHDLPMASNLPQERPYVMVKEDKNLTGNARFEGFCIDLLKWIAGQVGFQYVIKLVPDHMYGVYDPETKEWNGIVRELMEKVRRETCKSRFNTII